MPRSSPSTRPGRVDTRTVEVVELDRDLQDVGPTELDSRPNRWAILLGILVLALVGLTLLPASDIEPNSADATLPDPAVATTLVGSSQPRLAFISDDTFPMFVVSGLKGFVSLTEPVFFDERWWIVGNRPDPATAAVVLSSENGRLWVASSEIPGEAGLSIRIDQLTSADGALIAVGTEGTLIGPSFYSTLAGNLGLWRSEDGVRWVPEVVDPGNPHLAFVDVHLAISERFSVLQATVISTAPADAAVQLPSPVVGGLADGRFTLTTFANRLIVQGPLGIAIAEAPMAGVAMSPSTRVFHSEAPRDWIEVDVPFSANGDIVAAPDGGFVAGTGSVPFSSAYGVNWKPNPRTYDAHFYQQWGQDILGIYFGDNRRTIEFIDAAGGEAVQLPQEMAHCGVKGSNGLLAAACSAPPTMELRQVQWNGLELSASSFTWLNLRDPATPVVREFPLQRVAGIYDAETDTISLADRRGVREAFPVEVLRQLVSDPNPQRYETMLSREGLTWSTGQIALRASEMQLLGGVGDGFLVATRSSEPGATLTVLAADF